MRASDRKPHVAVVDTVATLLCTAPLDVTPVHETVDVDALDELASEHSELPAETGHHQDDSEHQHGLDQPPLDGPPEQRVDPIGVGIGHREFHG